MLKDYEREIATAMVEGLIEYGLAEHFSSDIETWFYNSLLNSLGFWVRTGISKACIGHRDLCNWVIKIGFKNESSIDYAKLEYENYCAAEEAGYEEYFAKVVYLGEFSGCPFYLQEYANCNEDQVSSDWYDLQKEQMDENGEEYQDDEVWDIIWGQDDDERAMMCFGDRHFCEFLARHKINDLHEGNFGYIDNRLVIIDFSGWLG